MNSLFRTRSLTQCEPDHVKKEGNISSSWMETTTSSRLTPPARIPQVAQLSEAWKDNLLNTAFQTCWLPTMLGNLKAINIHSLPRVRFHHMQITTVIHVGEWKMESAVKITKNIMKKSYHDYLHVAFRNTPQQEYKYSPLQCLKSRRLDPTPLHQFIPQTVSLNLVHENITERRQRSKAQYNKRSSVHSAWETSACN